MSSAQNRQRHFLALLLLPALLLGLLLLSLFDAMRIDLVALDIVPPAAEQRPAVSATILKLANSVAPPTPLLPIVAVDSNRQLLDSTGQTRLFRGMGVCYKGPPFIPLTDRFDPVLSFADEDIATLKRLGLNTIRYGRLCRVVDLVTDPLFADCPFPGPLWSRQKVTTMRSTSPRSFSLSRNAPSRQSTSSSKRTKICTLLDSWETACVPSRFGTVTISLMAVRW